MKLNGRKSYIVALAAVLTGAGGFLSGEMSLAEALQTVLAGAGVAALRHGISKGGK